MDRALALEADGRSLEGMRGVTADDCPRSHARRLARAIGSPSPRSGDAEARSTTSGPLLCWSQRVPMHTCGWRMSLRRIGRSADAKRCCAVAAALDSTVFARLGLGMPRPSAAYRAARASTSLRGSEDALQIAWQRRSPPGPTGRFENHGPSNQSLGVHRRPVRILPRLWDPPRRG